MGQNVRKNYGGRCGEKQCSGAKSEKRRDQSKHYKDRHSEDKSRADKTRVDECRDELLKEIDDFLEHLEEQMNREFMQAGKTLAELYRAMCMAAAKLPNLELHTELMCVHNDEDGLTVIFHRDVAEGIAPDPDDEADENDESDDSDDDDDGGDYEFGDYYDFNEEEEMLYDGD